MASRSPTSYDTSQARKRARRRPRKKSFLSLRMALLGLTCLFVLVVLIAYAVLQPGTHQGENDGETDQEGMSQAGSRPVIGSNGENNSNGDESDSDNSEGSATGVSALDMTELDWVTVDLLPINEYSRSGKTLSAVNSIVIHYTGNPGTTAEQNRNYYEELATTHERSVSSHFLVGIDGTVIQCVPTDEVAFANYPRNYDTISIECCHPDSNGKFTSETVESLVKLVKYLVEAYDLEREDVIRHYDVSGKECPVYYVKNEDAWEKLLDQIFKQ